MIIDHLPVPNVGVGPFFPRTIPVDFQPRSLSNEWWMMEIVKGKAEALCEQCSEGKATALCRHCTGFICKECVKIHQKLKAFAEHKVMSLEDPTALEGEIKDILVRKSPPEPCKVHNKQKIIYCFDCNCLICKDCTMLKIYHKGHKYDFVMTTAFKTIDTIEEKLVPLKEVQESLSDATDTLKSTKSDIEGHGLSVATMIEQSFNEAHEALDERKRQLLENVSSIVREKLGHLSIQEKRFASASSTIQSLVDFVEKNIENGTKAELMTIHTQMLKRINEVTRKNQFSDAALQPVEKPTLMVQDDCGKAMRKVIQEKARLVECSVEGPGIRDAEVGKPAFVRVSFKSSKSTFVRVPGQSGRRAFKRVCPVSLESKLISTYGSVQAKVEQKSDSMYEIEYVPKFPGHSNLEITANGLPVPESPYPVFTKISPTQRGKPLKVIGGFAEPIGVAINSAGNILVAEYSGDVKILDKSGKKINTIDKKCHGFECLQSIAVDEDDNCYLTDTETNKLFKFNRLHQLVKVVERKNYSDLKYPYGVTVTKEEVVVGSRDYPYLYIFKKDLNRMRVVGLHRAGIVNGVMGIASDERKHLYVCDHIVGCVSVLSLNGQPLYSLSNEQLKYPHSVCLNGGLIYVTAWHSDAKCKTMFVFNKEREFVTSFAGLPLWIQRGSMSFSQWSSS